MSSSFARDFAYEYAACADSRMTSPNLAGQNQVAFAFHPQCFDEQNVAADGSPRQACGHADLIFLQHFLGNDLRRAEKLMQVLERNSDRSFVAFGDASRDFAADPCRFRVPVAAARLPACTAE